MWLEAHVFQPWNPPNPGANLVRGGLCGPCCEGMHVLPKRVGVSSRRRFRQRRQRWKRKRNKAFFCNASHDRPCNFQCKLLRGALVTFAGGLTT